MRSIALAFLPIMAIVFGGCGSEAENISDLFAGLGPGDRSRVIQEAKRQISVFREQAQVLQTQAQQLYFQKLLSGDDCSAFGMTIHGGTCTPVSCTLNTWVGNCTYTEDYEFSCNGTDYKVKNGELGYSLHMDSNVFNFIMTMDVDVEGGDLDGNVECQIDFEFDLNDPDDVDFNCDNVECKYNDDEIDCEDLQENYGNEC